MNQTDNDYEGKYHKPEGEIVASSELIGEFEESDGSSVTQKVQKEEKFFEGTPKHQFVIKSIQKTIKNTGVPPYSRKKKIVF